MNPELFDIENKKTFGLWPHDQLISLGLNPYIKRFKQDKIALAIVGDLLGESVSDFLENNQKVVKVNVINNYEDESLREVFNQNTQNNKSKIEFGLAKNKHRDVICLYKNACTLENLELYYDNLKNGGIFCGNGHETIEVKDVLNKFRRKMKIGTAMMIANRTIWFWYKR